MHLRLSDEINVHIFIICHVEIMERGNTVRIRRNTKMGGDLLMKMGVHVAFVQ